jgi:hypothetical protein
MSTTATKITSTSVLRGVTPSSKALPVISGDIDPIINDLVSIDARVTVAEAGTFSAGLTVTGAISATTTVTGTTGVITDIITPVTSGAGTKIKTQVGIVSGSTLTSATAPAISALTSGSVYTLAAAAITVTLPACSAANVGLSYEFVTTTIATAQIINTTGSDVFLGSVYSTLAVVNATNDTACGSSTANKTMTMNGTTTGGLPGSRIRVTCISATQWLVSGFVIGASGTQATLFSN